MEAVALDGHFATFLAANTNGIVEFVEENFAVTDFARKGSFKNRVDRWIDCVVLQHELDFDFGQKINVVLSAPEHFGVALLTTVPAHLREVMPSTPS